MTPATPETDDDKTRPPVVAARFETVNDLYSAIPQVAEMTHNRPLEAEAPLHFMVRLRGSTTPEEAVTFTAFVVHPKLAIWWGHECLRQMPNALTPTDRSMMEMVSEWISAPTTERRHAIMKEALWCPIRCPGVHLALAVGWSGGSIAPNDPANVPLHRTPRAVNTAILSCLAQVDLSKRQVFLARFIDMAESMLRVY
jgi:hypothetical protein